MQQAFSRGTYAGKCTASTGEFWDESQWPAMVRFQKRETAVRQTSYSALKQELQSQQEPPANVGFVAKHVTTLPPGAGDESIPHSIPSPELGQG